ncbi:MAG: class I SAM-dependent methyltransferase [Bacteroidia bacterium]
MRDLNYDKYYLREEKREEPKEIFKFILEKASVFLDSKSAPVIADIGCATGDFLYYIRSRYPQGIYSGLDYDHELIELAKKRMNFAKFNTIDIGDKDHLPAAGQFDAIFMTGVHTYFEDLSTWSANLMSLLKKGGRAYVFGQFNPESIDVLTRVRYPEKSNEFNTWGNLHSVYSVRKEFAKFNAEVNMSAFEITIDVARNTSDPLRSWTFKDDKGKRIIINGAQVVQTFMLAEIIPH